MIQSLSIWFNNGGPYMWAILLILAFACAVAIERIVFYYTICNKSNTIDVESLIGMLKDKSVDATMMILNKNTSPTVVLLKTAIESFKKGLALDEIQENIEVMAIKQVPRFSERLNYLSLFANISTLLGLLGTIAGLQISFSSLATMEAAKKATMLADGISQAMITTAFGLIVAIPCMVMYTFLVNKQNRLIKDLDETCIKFLNFLKRHNH